MRFKLIDDWKVAHRFNSVRLMSLGGIVQLLPAESFLWLYNLVPADLQFLLPGRTFIVAGCFALAMLARIVKQPTLAADACATPPPAAPVR